MTNSKGISLVLGGGGARGLAHVGVLKALEELNIPVLSICGCSMGGLVASMYAIGMSVKEIESVSIKYSSTREMVKLVDVTPHRKGIIIGQKLRGFLSKFIDPDIMIEDTTIPLYMNAVDLNTGSEVVLHHGNLLDAILSTTAVPGVFSPFTWGESTLADGGVVDNLPIWILKENSEYPIVAVDVHQTFTKLDNSRSLQNVYPRYVFPEFIREYYLAELIRVRKLTDLQIEKNPPDLLLVPEVDPGISLFFGFQKVKELINAGEKIIHDNKDQILDLVK